MAPEDLQSRKKGGTSDHLNPEKGREEEGNRRKREGVRGADWVM